ncbi:hypothetical protein K469DRAFT_694673 [Zopfia rhizophila CBS 207.26]|uniref:Uncharacterized protein n=1 Tax=Zopfia rhizophila CBS 207.26 TaxID=1314779 RepID=A0A6A6ENP6_9PEZI|nr:hypothetical protein K469DRAFT_694673 [Zopfia rhizophila CBS 207.26]
MFKDDFSIGVICISLGIRQKDFAVEPDRLSHYAPNNIVWAALGRAVDIFQAQAGQSYNHFQVYMGPVSLAAVLEFLECRTPMLDNVKEAAQTIIETVQNSKGINFFPPLEMPARDHLDHRALNAMSVSSDFGRCKLDHRKDSEQIIYSPGETATGVTHFNLFSNVVPYLDDFITY